jgi:dienelactone hydrolase
MLALLLLGLTATRSEPVSTRPEVLGPARLEAALNESVLTLPVTITLANGRRQTVETMLTVFRPSGAGPFPLVILSHGRNSDRTEQSRTRMLSVAAFFVRRGFAVLVPHRVGYGGFTAIDPERGGVACSDASARQQIDAVRAHVSAALDAAQKQAWADAKRVLLVGQSVGGYTSIATAALGHSGVVGVINFAGGAGARMKAPPGKPLCPERVERVLRSAGQTLRLPTLWIYGRNDRFWGAEWPKRWHAAFRSAGGVGELVFIDNAPGDGHGAIGEINLWRRSVDAFLKTLGVKPPAAAGAPPATAFARLDEIEKLPATSERARTGYMRFLRGDLPRAFVVGANGSWAFQNGRSNALADALAECARHAKSDCKPYAVDDAVVWTP